MPRYFVPITKEEFGRQISKLEDKYNDQVELAPHIQKDLNKCEWDTENQDRWMETLPNGMIYEAHSQGGDWEIPIYFIIYWDGKQLRGYIPIKGNPWNHTNKMAFGNGEAYCDRDAIDGEAILKQYPEFFAGRDPKTIEVDEVDRDESLIKEDIMERILPHTKKPHKKLHALPPISSVAYANKNGSICPFCKKDFDFVGHFRDAIISATPNGSEVGIRMQCNHCDASWNNIFKLTGYTTLEAKDGN